MGRMKVWGMLKSRVHLGHANFVVSYPRSNVELADVEMRVTLRGGVDYRGGRYKHVEKRGLPNTPTRHRSTGLVHCRCQLDFAVMTRL